MITLRATTTKQPSIMKPRITRKLHTMRTLPTAISFMPSSMQSMQLRHVETHGAK